MADARPLGACLGVTVHVTSSGAQLAADGSAADALYIPSELLPFVHVTHGRPDFSARLSALELLSGLDTRLNADLSARSELRPYVRTQVYFCGNPVVDRELGRIVARENVVGALAELRHHMAYTGESFSAGPKQPRAGKSSVVHTFKIHTESDAPSRDPADGRP